MAGIADGKSALELISSIAKKEISPVDLMKETLSKVETLDPKLNCFSSFTPENAMLQAIKAEQDVMNGLPQIVTNANATGAFLQVDFLPA